MSGPRVSVCIPTHQGADHLAEALDSVLASDDADFEVVVLVNASTDGTDELLARYTDPRIRVEHTAGLLDLPANWRRACDLTRGRYLKLVCDDDRIAPDCLRREADVLDAEPDCALVAHRRDIIDGAGALLAPGQGLTGFGPHTSGATVAARTVAAGINTIGGPSNVMFRRADYDAVGGWDATFFYPMDLVLFLELLRRGHLHAGTDSLGAFRIGSGSLSSGHTRDQYAELSAFLHSVAADPQWRVPWWATLVGAVTRPVRWWLYARLFVRLPAGRAVRRAEVRIEPGSAVGTATPEPNSE